MAVRDSSSCVSTATSSRTRPLTRRAAPYKLTDTTLDATCCSKRTDASLAALAGSCPSLTSLYVAHCYKLTDASRIALVEGCPRLTALDVSWCYKPTNAITTKVVATYPSLKLINPAA
jgi:hypothetical protein